MRGVVVADADEGSSRPPSVMSQMPMMRMTASTKYAWPRFEPAKRDLRPARLGWLSWRMAMSTRMPSVIVVTRNSRNISYGTQWPMIGSVQSALKSWPKAFAKVSTSERKAMAMNQCAAPTTFHRFIRVWPRNSRSTVTVRATRLSVRVPAGTSWPSRTTR